MTSIQAHKMAAAATPLFTCLVGLLLLLVTGSPGAAQESGRTVPSDLLRKAWDEGKVRVIVEVGGAGAVPEGQLLSHAAVTGQRGRIGSNQLALRSALRGLRHRVLREFKTIPYVGLEVDYDALRVLDSLPGLATRVHEDILLRPVLAQSAPLIKAPDAWKAGWDGSGQLIAIIDSGVDKTHPFLAGRVVAEACFDSSGVSTCPNGLTSDTSPGAGMPCTFASDCFHGTHVAGVAAGNGPSFDGIARGANLMAVRTAHYDVCDGSPCTSHFFSDMVAGLEHIYDVRSTHNFAAVNVSLTVPGVPFFSPCDTYMSAMTNIIANLRSAGIATVIASGNDADGNADFFVALSFPACISSAISVGSTKDGSGPGGTPADEVSLFSNSASFLSLLAPGEWITSSVPGGGFDTFRGTSLAAPHVAGAWAIAKQANPGASVSDILAGLQNTGKPILDPGNGYVFSRVAATVLQFSASTYSVAEAVGTATITVTRSGSMFGPNFAPLTVDYATSPGTAITGHDYTDTSGTLVFNAGDISKTFTVQIVPDSRNHGSRTVNLALTNPGGGVLLGMWDAAVLTIGDDDVGGSIQFAASGFNVSEQAGTATITVKRSGGIAEGVTVDVLAKNGTAKLGMDYGAPNPVTLVFDPGDKQKTFVVPILSNPSAVASRSLTLKLQNAAGGGTLGSPRTATLTITKAGMRFSRTAYAVNAGSAAIITIRRAGRAPGAVVTYATEDGNDADPAKNAHAGTDYQAISPTQLSPAFGSGQRSRTFAVRTLKSGAHGNRTLLLHLSNASKDPLGQPATAILTILGTAQPELQLTAFTPPELAILGKSFAVPNTVRNFSGAAAGASTLQFFLSTDSTWAPGGTFLGERAVPALAAGARSSATTMLTVPTNAGVPTGSYQILAVVDAHAQVAEQDETNNVLAQPLTVVSNLVEVTAHDGDDDTPGADAVAGVDYEVLTPSRLGFGASVSSQTVEIALLPRADAQLRAFRVTLHDANGQAALGSPLDRHRLGPRPAGLRRFAALPRERALALRSAQHLRQRYR